MTHLAQNGQDTRAAGPAAVRRWYIYSPTYEGFREDLAQHGMTLAQFAATCGVNIRTVRGWGKRRGDKIAPFPRWAGVVLMLMGK